MNNFTGPTSGLVIDFGYVLELRIFSEMHAIRKMAKCMTMTSKHNIHNDSFPLGAKGPSGQGPPHYRCLTITMWGTIHGWTPLDEWSVRRADLYLATHNTHKRHPCPRWDSNPKSQHTSGRIHTPYTTRSVSLLLPHLCRSLGLQFRGKPSHLFSPVSSTSFSIY